jgi:hypothetical protein
MCSVSRGPPTASFRPEQLFFGPKSTIFHLFARAFGGSPCGLINYYDLQQLSFTKKLEELKFANVSELF